jgi:hypothetical protein
VSIKGAPYVMASGNGNKVFLDDIDAPIGDIYFKYKETEELAASPAVASSASFTPVNIAPAIVTEPVGGGFITGTAATAKVVINANAFPVPTAQWKKRVNGVDTNVAGQTSLTLNLNNAQPAMSGVYFCFISNALGTVTTQLITLTISQFSQPEKLLTPTEFAGGASFNADTGVLTSPALGQALFNKKSRALVPADTGVLTGIFFKVKNASSGVYCFKRINALGPRDEVVAGIRIFHDGETYIRVFGTISEGVDIGYSDITIPLDVYLGLFRVNSDPSDTLAYGSFYVATSPDGVNWTPLNAPQFAIGPGYPHDTGDLVVAYVAENVASSILK